MVFGCGLLGPVISLRQMRYRKSLSRTLGRPRTPPSFVFRGNSGFPISRLDHVFAVRSAMPTGDAWVVLEDVMPGDMRAFLAAAVVLVLVAVLNLLVFIRVCAAGLDRLGQVDPRFLRHHLRAKFALLPNLDWRRCCQSPR